MTFIRPTLSDLITRAEADIDSRLPGADSRLRRSALSVLARTHAGAMHGAYGRLDDIARFLPDVADSDRLARWGSILGIARKAAVASAGMVTLTGVNGVVVPAGTILTRADGFRFATVAAIEIVGPYGNGAIEAVEPGAAGETGGYSTLTFASPVSGVAARCSVDYPGARGGADEESDEELRDRVLLRMRSPVRGGSANDYVTWAREISEVTRAWVYPNWNGLGTVQVLFVTDGRPSIIPTAGDVAAVAAHIAALRPVAAAVTVAAPVAQPLNLTIALNPDTPAVRGAVEAELRDLISREAEPGGTLLHSHIEEAISIAAGEYDHVTTSPAGNVTADPGAITTLGAITWA